MRIMKDSEYPNWQVYQSLIPNEVSYQLSTDKVMKKTGGHISYNFVNGNIKTRMVFINQSDCEKVNK